MKIYTKKGDQGETSLIGGDRVRKDHIRIECYGTVDELNSQIGMVRALNMLPEINIVLNTIQDSLFTIGSLLASTVDSKMKLPEISEFDVIKLEESIDKMESELPELRSFILPQGSALIASCHIARCVTRRAERLVVHLAEMEEVNPMIVKYLNRLSDYFFVLSRFEALKNGIEEVL